MPLKRLRPRSGINRLTPDLVDDLQYGPGMILDRSPGYQTPDLLTLRAAWVLHRAHYMDKYEGGGIDGGIWSNDIGQRPWAWWQFECPEVPADIEGRGAVVTLRALGLFTAEEEAFLSAQHADHESRGHTFYLRSCQCRDCCSVGSPVTAPFETA